MPNIPNTNQGGMILHSVGDGQNSSRWDSAIVPIPRTWAVAGTLANATLPGFHCFGAQTLVSVRGVLGTGTCTVAVLQNGTSVGTFNLTTTSLALTALGASAADGDYIQITISAVASAADLNFDLLAD